MTEPLKLPPVEPFAPRRPRASDYLASEVAVLLSVLLHALAFAAWHYRGPLAKFTLFKPIAAILETVPRPAKPPPPPAPVITFVEEAPKPRDNRSFMETDASQLAVAAPKDAKYYSDRSTAAANPVNPTGQTGDTPFLDGKDTRMTSTESVVPKLGIPAPPRPPPPPPPEPPKPAPETPKKVAETGIKIVEENKVAMATKPPEPARPPPEPVRPAAPAGAGSHREIAALKSRLSASGVASIGVAAFNVAGSPFGDYDKALIRAVQSRWYALIEKNGLYERAGQVTLKFNLLADGSVQSLATKENTAGEILGLFCEKAIVDSAPFPPLSDELHRIIGEDAREVNFTFYY